MNEFILNRGDITRHPLYNCSAAVEQPETGRVRHRHPVWGFTALVYGCIAEILYFLCLIVISKKTFYQHACYKIMFILGCVDMVSVLVSDFFIAYFLANGLEFCDSPNIIYIAGCFNMASWASSCFFCLYLVLNRILDISQISYSITRFFFSQKSIRIFSILGLLYGTYVVFFPPPPLFANKIGISLVDPLIFEDKSHLYTNGFFFFNNLVVVALTSSLYILYCIVLYGQFKKVGNLNSNQRRLKNQVFAQATILCCLNFSASLIFTACQFLSIPPIVLSVTEMSYQFATGVPAFIYLSMNESIRKGMKNELSRRITSTKEIQIRSLQRNNFS